MPKLERMTVLEERLMLMSLVGIWWDDGETLVALSHAIDENSTGSNLRDSNLVHAQMWPEIAHRFQLTDADEYFSIPRGRVLFNRAEDIGWILHGNETSPERLRVIAKRFDLSEWTGRIDEHYLMGAAADELFDED